MTEMNIQELHAITPPGEEKEVHEESSESEEAFRRAVRGRGSPGRGGALLVSVKRSSLVHERQRWRASEGCRLSSSEESDAEPSLSRTTRTTADDPRHARRASTPLW